MIVAIDVHYRETEAKIVAVAFENWSDKAPSEVFIANKTDIEEYEPSAFFKRELLCVVEIMQQIDLNSLDYLVIDGYV